MSLSKNFPTVFPSLLLDFAKVRRLDPRITFTRATPGTYYDGTTSVKAEENLLINSVLAGAVAGTPGTAPTSWSFSASGGSVVSVSVGTDGVSNVLTLSATVARQVLDQSFSATSNTVFIGQVTIVSNPNSLVFNQLFLLLNLPVGSTVVYKSNGVVVDSTTFVPLPNSLLTIELTIGGTNGTPSFRIAVGASATATGSAGFTRPQLEQRNTVTAYIPTTTQAIANYIPVLLTAPAGTARFDANPVTGQSLGLLIEEARINLTTYSAEVGGTNWSLQAGVTSTLNSTIAPNGTQTASLLTCTNTNTGTFQSPSLAAGTYSMSVYVKKGTGSIVVLGIVNVLDAINYNFDTGVIGGLAASTASATNVGNGWIRLAFSAACSAGNFGPIIKSNSAGQTVFVWGVQFELGAFATTYIATVATTQARNADLAVMTGTNFTSWYNPNQGTFYINYVERALSAAHQLTYTVLSSDSSNRINIGVNNVNVLDGQIVVDGVDNFTGDTPTLTAQRYQIIMAYATNNAGISANASAVNTDIIVTLPLNLNQFAIGATTGASQCLNSTIAKIAYYDSRLVNSQLQALTRS